MKRNCMYCGEEIIDDYIIETPNLNFVLCLECAIEVEGLIEDIIEMKRKKK